MDPNSRGAAADGQSNSNRAHIRALTRELPLVDPAEHGLDYLDPGERRCHPVHRKKELIKAIGQLKSTHPDWAPWVELARCGKPDGSWVEGVQR